MDTLERRWKRLWPHIIDVAPQGPGPHPAVLLFPGCGGVRVHVRRYAQAAAEAGVRAFLVDSYAPRGWSNRFASAFVCSGLAFRGDVRAGDVLAALWGVSQLAGVEPGRIALAGWSHGSWSIMDLMTMALTRPGEARILNPTPAQVDRLASLFLAYPYVNVIARSRSVVWKRKPRVFGIVPLQDHLASVRAHMRAYAAAVAAGAEVEIWPVDATHAFDEPGLKAPPRIMRHDPELLDAAIGRFREFLRTL